MAAHRAEVGAGVTELQGHLALLGFKVALPETEARRGVRAGRMTIGSQGATQREKAELQVTFTDARSILPVDEAEEGAIKRRPL
ncbi:hypothetical protein QR97_28610 [Streptomyces sp. PBH53]|nr:hypothetical protein QR97_28610 [Streptomyces sp. PBH53]